VAMGAVFAAAARAPLTSLASVVEMTGDFSLTLPVMLAVAIAASVSRALSYGTIYTTKLLRRGTDIDRATPLRGFSDLTVADAMNAFPAPLPASPLATDDGDQVTPDWPAQLGSVTHTRGPQVLFANESLGQALRQLVLYGRDGLPVLSTDGQHVLGWITNQALLEGLGRQLNAVREQAIHGQLAADTGLPDPESGVHKPGTPLPGYQVVEITVTESSPVAGRTLRTISWPPFSQPVSVIHRRKLDKPDPGITLAPGDRINVLVPAPIEPRHEPHQKDQNPSERKHQPAGSAQP